MLTFCCLHRKTDIKLRWRHTIRNCDFRCESLDFSYFQLAIYTVLDEESDFEVKVAQFRRPEVENRESQFLIVGFLIVRLHRRFRVEFRGCLRLFRAIFGGLWEVFGTMLGGFREMFWGHVSYMSGTCLEGLWGY